MSTVGTFIDISTAGTITLPVWTVASTCKATRSVDTCSIGITGISCVAFVDVGAVNTISSVSSFASASVFVASNGVDWEAVVVVDCFHCCSCICTFAHRIGTVVIAGDKALVCVGAGEAISVVSFDASASVRSFVVRAHGIGITVVAVVFKTLVNVDAVEAIAFISNVTQATVGTVVVDTV